MELQTKLGKLIVEKSGYSEEDYPGYYVALISPNGEALAEVLLEVDATENAPECKIHVWDTTNDEPILSFRGIPEGDSLVLDTY